MVIEVSSTTLTTDEDEIRNTTLIDPNILAPSAERIELLDEYMPIESVDERGDKVDTEEGQNTTEELSDTP